MKQLSFLEWTIRLKYALVAAGIFKRGKYLLHIKINEKEWKHFYEDGFSPLEAVIEDLKNQP